jgi:hypothetical protein
MSTRNARPPARYPDGWRASHRPRLSRRPPDRPAVVREAPAGGRQAGAAQARPCPHRAGPASGRQLHRTHRPRGPLPARKPANASQIKPAGTCSRLATCPLRAPANYFGCPQVRCSSGLEGAGRTLWQAGASAASNPHRASKQQLFALDQPLSLAEAKAARRLALTPTSRPERVRVDAASRRSLVAPSDSKLDGIAAARLTAGRRS